LELRASEPGDRVGSGAIARGPGQGATKGVAEDERARGDRVGQGRITLVIDLGLRVGGDLDRADRHGQVRADEGEIVVGARGQGPDADGMDPTFSPVARESAPLKVSEKASELT